MKKVKGVVKMNEKKSTFLRVNVDNNTELAFKKILEIKGLTIQSVLENLLKDYIFQNLNCIINNESRK